MENHSRKYLINCKIMMIFIRDNDESEVDTIIYTKCLMVKRIRLLYDLWINLVPHMCIP